MSSKRRGRLDLLICLLLVLPVLSSACGGESVKRTAVTELPGWETATAPPVFQKVPPEENAALVPPDQAGGSTAGAPYQLEMEDQLSISIYGEEDLQHVDVPIRPDGMISFAFIGDVKAAGRTVEEVRGEMTERLSRFLRSPQVTVIAKNFAQKKIYIGGQVRSPGILYLTGKEGTLLDALYKAGLTTDKADLEDAYLMRGNKVVDANFKQLVRGDITSNIRLMDQDIIFIPENTRRYVYVLGEVHAATAVESLEPFPIIRALAQAGWFNVGANRREIAVVRGGLKTPEIAIVNARALVKGDLSQNILVKPGDIIYVAPGPIGKFNYVIDEILRAISPIVQATIVSNTVNP